VLPAGFVKIRHFGFLANACRKVGLSLARKLAGTPVLPDLLTPRQKDAIHRRCPACGLGSLCVLGWIPPVPKFLNATVDSS
jgi:hypothetical protein